MFNNIKYLENINDFPKVGLLYFDNSGENLLRYYLERIFHVKTGSNINKENNPLYKATDDIDMNWLVCSDFPSRNTEEYNPVNLSYGILLVRNPVDLIMSKILNDSYFLEEALDKIDLMIDQWKEFNKYWLHAPIPIHVIRYEDLLYEPQEILKQLCKFILGIKAVENTKLEYLIKQSISERIDKHYYAYDVEVREDNQSILTPENIEKIKAKFYSKLEKMLKKLNYEVTSEAEAINWMAEFNKDNLIKSVEFHDFLNSQFMTSSYFTIKIG